LPRNRVIGSGTVLDSARLRSLISANCHADPRNVHVNIIGEHGDSEVAAWSAATIGGVPIASYCADCHACPRQGNYGQLLDEVKRAAYEIISRKGATFYAIGLALTQITEAILRDEHRILPVSSVISEFHGIHDVALSLPALLGAHGIERVIDLDLAPEEQKALEASAAVIKSSLQKLNLAV
jgi:L-lactate dehydrogenase